MRKRRPSSRTSNVVLETSPCREHGALARDELLRRAPAARGIDEQEEKVEQVLVAKQRVAVFSGSEVVRRNEEAGHAQALRAVGADRLCMAKAVAVPVICGDEEDQARFLGHRQNLARKGPEARVGEPHRVRAMPPDRFAVDAFRQEVRRVVRAGEDHEEVSLARLCGGAHPLEGDREQVVVGHVPIVPRSPIQAGDLVVFDPPPRACGSEKSPPVFETVVGLPDRIAAVARRHERRNATERRGLRVEEVMKARDNGVREPGDDRPESVNVASPAAK